MRQEEAILKVSEAFQQDVGYGRSRIDNQTRMELDLSIGDVIEIEGTKITASVVWRAHPTDEGKRIIRIDNLTRKNAGTGLGDRVKIRRADVKVAREVVLAPLISKGQQIQFGSGIEILIKKGLLKRPLTKGDNVIIPGIALFGSALPFVIINTSPSGIILISDSTSLKVKEEAAKTIELEGPRVSYEDIGGLKDELEKVKEMIQLPIKHPTIFNRLGIDPPKGVLLHGPPGTGKTLIAKAVANESGASFYTINGPEIMSKFYGQSEENLRKIFEDAEKNAPSIIFIDEIDAIAPKRSEVHGEVERRVVSQLLTLMDGLKGRGKLIVIGATNIPDSIDPALRRPGRFDREIRIAAPDRNGRKEILQIHTRGMPKTPPFYKSIALEELQAWMKEIAIPKMQEQIRDKKIEDERNRRDIKDLEKDNSSLKEELQNLEQELIKNKQRIGYGTSSRIEKLIESLTLKKTRLNKELDETERKIGEINQKIEENSKKVNELDNKIKDKKALEELFELEKKMKLSDEIIQEMIYGQKQIESRMQLIGVEDSRYELMKNSQVELEKLLDKIKDQDIRNRLLNGLRSDEIKSKIDKRSLDVMLNEIADVTYGFVGADLAALAREAAMNALRRYLPEIDLEKPIPVDVLERMEVTMADFKSAQRGIEPSAMREFFVEVPKVTWKDVGGLENVKQSLKESVEWPLTKPEVFKRMGIKAPRGILLYGPPGTGKTLLAKAVANESKANFISIKGPEVMSKWVGESEKAIRELFKRAKQVAPAIVFLDEIDSIAPRRGAYSGSHVTESVVNQILTSVDGLESMEGVVIIGATNRPDILDPSLLRPGRFDRLLLIPSPDLKSRLEIFKIHTRGMPLTKDVSLEELAKQCENFSGADIEGVCREAAMLTLRDNIKAKEVSKKYFEKALSTSRPSITNEIMQYYKKVTEELSGGMAKKDKNYKDIQYM